MFEKIKSLETFPSISIVRYGRYGAYMRIGIGAFIAPFIFNAVMG